MTYNELIYMVLDELKLNSDDSYFTPDHIIFLLSKYRSFLLKLRYTDIKKPIPDSNYLVICLDLEKNPAYYCGLSNTLRSVQTIPNTMTIGTPRVYPFSYYDGEITFVSRDRMRYIGYNNYMRTITYASKAPDNLLYLSANNPLFLHLEKVQFSAIFEDTLKASELSCDEELTLCKTEDKVFPIEDALVPPLIELIVRDLKGVQYTPKDEANDAHDDLSTLNQKVN